VQASQLGGVLLVAGTVCTVPAGQASLATHVPQFAAVLLVPSGQGRQLRSSVLLGVLAW
jgi:hypothetical protein